MTFRTAFVVALIATAFGASFNASAHEQAIGFTEVSVIQSEDGDCSNMNCRLEVAHRVSIHDAESTLMSVLGARPDLTRDPEAQNKLSAYVADRFALGDPDRDKSLELTLLGGEVERGHYWVYQEVILDEPLAALSIAQGMLMDAIPAQTNRVNVKIDERVKTLIFSTSPGPKILSLD